jgi:hypothetical protein
MIGPPTAPTDAQRPAPTVCAFFSVPSVEPPSKKKYLAHGRTLGTPPPPCPLVPSAQHSSVVLETSFFGLESRFPRKKLLLSKEKTTRRRCAGGMYRNIVLIKTYSTSMFDGICRGIKPSNKKTGFCKTHKEATMDLTFHFLWIWNANIYGATPNTQIINAWFGTTPCFKG